MMRKVLLLILSILSVCVHAQTETAHLSGGIMPGFLIAHRTDLKNIESHMMGFEFQWEQSKSKGLWTNYYREPVSGYGVSVFNLNRKETGLCISAHANLRFTIAEMGKTDLQLRLGTGLGYLTKVFDPYTNRRNQAIGSHLNAFMQTAVLLKTDLDKGCVQYGVGISHFSNAAFKMPNLGYNLPSLFLRYSARSFTSIGEIDTRRIRSGLKKRQLSVTAVCGQKERNFAKPVTFNNKGLHVRYLHKRSPIGLLRIGIDAMLDKTYKYSENTQIALDSISIADQLELGLAAGHEWNAGKLGFIMEVGAYISKPADLKKPLYQRMGFRYDVYKQLSVHGSLKFHRGVADYFEWGLMYSLEL